MQTDLNGEGYVEINILLLNGEIYITSVHGIVKEAAYLKKEREREKIKLENQNCHFYLLQRCQHCGGGSR